MILGATAPGGRMRPDVIEPNGDYWLAQHTTSNGVTLLNDRLPSFEAAKAWNAKVRDAYRARDEYFDAHGITRECPTSP